MTLYYLDSSAWVKRYLTETGSEWIRHLFERKDPFACCLLGYTEVSAALARRQGVREIPEDRQRILRRDIVADWDAMLHVPVDGDLARRAAALAWDYRLRGADAVHLAAMQWVRNALPSGPESLTLISADNELLAAAASCQFAVLNPLEYGSKP